MRENNKCIYGIPKGIIVIGNNDCGNKILICSIEGNNYGKVCFLNQEDNLDEEELKQLKKGEKPYYWTNEMYEKYMNEDGKFNEFYNIYFIANSFEEFINGLMTEEEMEKYLDKL